MKGHSVTTVHGHTGCGRRPSPTYSSWANAIRRCTRPNSKDKGYAGVIVCDRWIGKGRGLGFANFLADVGVRPTGTSLGRILDMGNYEKGNAFFMTPAEQGLARRNKSALLKWSKLEANR